MYFLLITKHILLINHKCVYLYQYKSFRQKLSESQQYTQIGQFWDRKGGNEIDIVAINEIDGIIDIYEVKKDKFRYDESLLKQKVDYMLQVYPELKKLEIRLGCLSLEDM